MRKWLVLVSSVLIQLCLGGVYAWSIFVTPLKENYGFTAAQTQMIFGITIGAFTLSMIFAGRLLDRKGPRPIAAIGGVLFALGYVAASLGSNFLLICLGIGILVGAGTGFGYVCPIATCVKWFPSHKGLITGVAVAGFGGGAIVLSQLAMRLLKFMDVLSVFRIVGIAYGAVIIASALLLSAPREDKVVGERPPSVMDIIRNRVSWGLCIGMFSGTFAGLMVIGSLKPIGLSRGLTAETATLGISFLAGGNAIGRLSWGWVYDRFGKIAIGSSLVFLTLAVLGLLAVGPDSTLWYPLACALTGFGFGACFVVYAAGVCTEFGSQFLGSVYPWIFIGYGASALIGPPIGGLLHDMTGGYSATKLLAAAVCAMGVIPAMILLRKSR
ncbi:MAG TPA: MFS transporter [Candidatus Sumerlaeota bacterium]|nr:MFS transporter [Candidatus Sumerlaeota bacterium]